MNKSPMRESALLFGVDIIRLVRCLEFKKSYVIAKQLLRCGTSIGANLAESVDPQSTNDFVNKVNIALKEARETKYWFDLLRLSGICSEAELSCERRLGGILAMLVATKKTIKNKQKKPIKPLPSDLVPLT